MQPSMLVRLLRKLTVDVSVLTEYTTVALRLLTLHFDRCGKYYSTPGGQGVYGAASEEERRLTMILFTNIFDSLAKMVSWFVQSFPFLGGRIVSQVLPRIFVTSHKRIFSDYNDFSESYLKFKNASFES